VARRRRFAGTDVGAAGVRRAISRTPNAMSAAATAAASASHGRPTRARGELTSTGRLPKPARSRVPTSIASAQAGQ
jgi:hypothetical protein